MRPQNDRSATFRYFHSQKNTNQINRAVLKCIKKKPKPLRSAERQFHAREHERLPDSSGTEGESSMQSQRSVVYLHATTIGAIPQPYQTSSRRRAASREDLRKNKLQPITKSVSVSMLAPWKPKHISEGYEINYSQEQNEKDKKLLTLPRKSTSTQVSSSSRLNRHKKIKPPTRARRQATSPHPRMTCPQFDIHRARVLSSQISHQPLPLTHAKRFLDANENRCCNKHL